MAAKGQGGKKEVDPGLRTSAMQYEEAEGSSAPQTQSWVHSQLVRREPPEQSQVRIEQGAIVEVSVKADGESEPASWWEAEVKEMREDFIKVRFLAGGDSIVESLRLRPAFSRGVAAHGPALG